MLFVLGIYLLSGRARSVLVQVSAFTVAHSITLGLSLYGVVAVSSKIVEPMIAISIAYVAIENIFLAELKSRRVALVFAFGLLHGMGFAGALKDLGLPRSEFLTALLTFNIGVETGLSISAHRMALCPSRLVPQPHRGPGIGADRLYGSLLDHRAIVVLKPGSSLAPIPEDEGSISQGTSKVPIIEREDVRDSVHQHAGRPAARRER